MGVCWNLKIQRLEEWKNRVRGIQCSAMKKIPPEFRVSQPRNYCMRVTDISNRGYLVELIQLSRLHERRCAEVRAQETRAVSMVRTEFPNKSFTTSWTFDCNRIASYYY